MTGPFETPERAAFRDTVARFVESELRPNANTWDEAGAMPWEVHEKAGALGLFGFGIPENLGGLGFEDPFMRATASELLSACGASGIGAALGVRNIATGLIAKLGRPDQTAVLPEVLAGRQGASLGITEPSGGSDVASLRTRAVRDEHGWVLNGEKTYITGGMTSHWFVIAARTGAPGLAGISLFLVPHDAPGFSRTALDAKQGWWASDTATLVFEDCRLPESALLGPQDTGFLSVMENFNFERLSIIASALGMARLCLSEATDWAKTRETFGQPLIRHQVIAHKLVEMSARIDALAAWMERICWQIDTGPMPVAELTKAKPFATKVLEFCASEAMQIFGGAAYMRGNPVERVWREVKVMAIGGGSEEVMRDLAARQMGFYDKRKS